MRDKLGRFIKGYSGSPKTEFKKGNPKPKNAYKFLRGEKHWNWKTGRISNNGHIMILCYSHPFRDRLNRVRRSRLVMEQHLGHYLKPEEVVHHLNGIRNDDRIENLKLFSNHSKHMKFHWRKKKLQAKNI